MLGQVVVVFTILFNILSFGACTAPFVYFTTSSGYVFSENKAAAAYNSEQQLLHGIDGQYKGYGTTYGLLGLITVRGVRRLVSINKATSIGNIAQKPVYRVDEVELLPERPGLGLVDAQYVKFASKVFQQTFYFSAHPLNGGDEDYTANKYLLKSLRQKSVPKSLVITAIAGHVGIETIDKTNVAIINRLNNQRIGLSAYVYGLDEQGNCANFGQSEMIVEGNGPAKNYVVYRGTTPLQVLKGHSDQLVNNIDDQSHVFLKHLKKIKNPTNRPIHIVDLLNGEKSAHKPFHEMLKKVVDRAQQAKMNIQLHSFTDFLKKRKEMPLKRQQQESTSVFGSIFGGIKSLVGKVTGNATKTANPTFRPKTQHLDEFINQLHLPSDAIIRVHCLDSVGDTDDAITLIMSKFVGSPQGAVIQEIFKEAKQQLFQQYLAGKAGEGASMLRKFVGVGASLMMREKQDARDCVYGTQWSPDHQLLAEGYPLANPLNVPRPKDT